MTTTTRPTRAACPRCQRPLRACLCQRITPTAHQMAVLILQHPLEQRQAKGSARLLQLSLRDCQREVGERFDPAVLAAWLRAPTTNGPAQPLLLYPAGSDDANDLAPGTRPAAPAAPLPAPGRWRLVLLDGTWRQTRQLLRANPLLHQLPRWALPTPPPSRYVIRKAQRPEQRSTLEAACLALAALEGRPARYAPLLAAFDGWVADQRAWIDAGQ